MKQEWAGYAPVVLRVVLAVTFLVHGLPKFTSAGHQMFQGMLTTIGVPAPEALSWVGGVIEVGGALLLLAGAFTTVASAFLALHMLVALVKVHLPNGYSFFHVTGMTESGPTFGVPGVEVPLWLIAMLVALMLGGAGKLSVDQKRAAKGAAP
ncbi:MAG: DoxX family protein [Gemmatimonadales bacterium]